MALPNQVKMVEVGPRDGLQHEAGFIPTNIKLELIQRLTSTGLKTIEATSFVSSKAIPQLADSAELFPQLPKDPSISYPVLVPNLQGLKNALAAGVREIAVFAAATETFSQRNIHCSISESLDRYAAVINLAKEHNIRVRGYVSCALGCPYEGAVNPQAVVAVAKKLFTLGCIEISVGDTIGVGTPGKAVTLIQAIAKEIPISQIAVHFHDTYGQALANIYAALEQGIAVIDSSVAGLGGCPYAPGASGNVASEDVLYLLNGLDITTGVDLNKLCDTGHFISQYLGRPSRSKVALAHQWPH